MREELLVTIVQRGISALAFMSGLFFHQMSENLADPIFATFRSNNGRDQDPLCWTTTEQTEPWGETKQPAVIRRGRNSPKMKISTLYQICLLVG